MEIANQQFPLNHGIFPHSNNNTNKKKWKKRAHTEILLIVVVAENEQEKETMQERNMFYKTRTLEYHHTREEGSKKVIYMY